VAQIYVWFLCTRKSLKSHSRWRFEKQVKLLSAIYENSLYICNVIIWQRLFGLLCVKGFLLSNVAWFSVTPVLLVCISILALIYWQFCCKVFIWFFFYLDHDTLTLNDFKSSTVFLVSKITYKVSSVTLRTTIAYHTVRVMRYRNQCISRGGGS